MKNIEYFAALRKRMKEVVTFPGFVRCRGAMDAIVPYYPYGKWFFYSYSEESQTLPPPGGRVGARGGVRNCLGKEVFSRISPLYSRFFRLERRAEIADG